MMTVKAPKISVIVFIDGKIPLLQRESGRDSWWDLPGGKVDGSEDHIQAAEREISEELGIQVNNCRVLGDMPHPFPQSSDEIIFVSCQHVAGAPSNRLPAEHKAMQLVEGEEAIQKLGKRINQNIASYIRNNA